MAVNVLLVFVHGAKPCSIQRYAWLCCVVCYGGPFAIALTCLLLNSPDKPLVYGDSGVSLPNTPTHAQANIPQAWCWINPSWRPLRIYTTYLPVWICILLSLAIHTTIGFHLFRTRGRPLPIPIPSTTASRSPSPTPTNNTRFLSPTPTPDPDHDRDSRACSTISISDWPLTPTAGGILSMSYTPFSDLLSGVGRRTSAVPADLTLPLRAHSPHRRPPVVQHARYPSNLSNGAPSGGLTPFLLASSPFPRTPTPNVGREDAMGTGMGLVEAGAGEKKGIDPLKRTYLVTALLFALAVTVTWLPGTVKEVWEARNPDGGQLWSMYVAVAVVLPLQGVWNGMVFVVGGWGVILEAFGKGRRGMGGHGDEEAGVGLGLGRGGGLKRGRRVSGGRGRGMSGGMKMEMGGEEEEKQQRRRLGMARRQQGRTVYSMWQDADPVSGDGQHGGKEGAGEGGGKGGVLSSWRRSKDTVRSSKSKRQDSWDFLDIGMDESQMRGLREKRDVAGHGKVMAVSSEVVGNKELIAGLKDVPGGMI